MICLQFILYLFICCCPQKADKNLKVMVLFKILPKWLVGFLVKTRLIYAVSSYFSLARKSLDEVLNGITKDRDLKAILSYNYADYGEQFS